MGADSNLYDSQDAREILRQARRGAFEKFFPESEEVASGEAIILKKDKKCIKLYKPEYSKAVIEKYVRITNSLRELISKSNIDEEISQRMNCNLTVEIMSVEEIDKIADQRVYTVSQFLEGANLKDLDMGFRNSGQQTDEKFLQMLISGDGVAMSICTSLDELFKGLLPETDHDAIRLHPDNVKVLKTGHESYKILVTDISCSIRSIRA